MSQQKPGQTNSEVGRSTKNPQCHGNHAYILDYKPNKEKEGLWGLPPWRKLHLCWGVHRDPGHIITQTIRKVNNKLHRIVTQTSYTSAQHAITVGSKSRITARIGSSRGKWCQSYITRVPQSIVTKDGPVGHIQLTAACLDLPTSSRTRPALTFHLLTTHRAVPSTTSFLSH